MAPTPDSLPEAFWSTHPVLEHIRTAARSRGTDPVGVLAHCLVRVSVLAGPAPRLDIGQGPVSGASYVALVQRSGGGKSKTLRAVDDLLPVPAALKETPGALEARVMSLEGAGGDAGYRHGVPNNGTAFLAMFEVPAVETDAGLDIEDDDLITLPGGPADPKLVTAIIPRVEVSTPEGDQILHLMRASRQSPGRDVPMETPFLLAFTSEPMSNFTSGREFRREVPGDSYVVGVTLGCQDSVAAELLAQTGRGLAQRFLFFRLNAESVADEVLEVAQRLRSGEEITEEAIEAAMNLLPVRPEFPGLLPGTVDHAVGLSRREPFLMQVSPGVTLRLRLLSAAVSAENGLSEEDPYVAHKVLQLMFLMKGFAVLLGSDEITFREWTLADQLERVASEHCARLLEEGREREASKKKVLRGDQLDRLALMKKADGATADQLRKDLVQRVAVRLKVEVLRLCAAGSEGVTASELRDRVTKMDTADFGIYASLEGSHRELQRVLLAEALAFTREKKLLDVEGVGTRVRYKKRS